MHRVFLIATLLLSLKIASAQVGVEYYNYVQYTSDQGLPHSLVFDIKQSKDGFIWVASNNGLGRFDGYNFKNFRPKKESKNSISGKSISKLFLDSRNNLWLCLQGIGLNKMALENEQFTNYSPTNENAISGNEVFSIIEDNDTTLWISTNNGIDFFDNKSQKFINVLKSDSKGQKRVTDLLCDNQNRLWFLASKQFGWVTKNEKKVHTLSDLVKIPFLNDSDVNSFTIHEGNKLWLATRNQGLLCINLETNKLERQISSFPNVGHPFFNKRGDLFFIANQPYNELFVIPKETIKANIIKPVYQFNKKSNDLWVNSCEDFDGNYWISLSEGLIKIHTDFSTSKILSRSYSTNDLLTEKIYCRFFDTMGNLWLGSERKGLIMIDLCQKQFKQYKYLKCEDPVIAGENITSVFEDSKGNIWTGCYGIGVSCYDRKTQKSKIIPFDATDQTKIIFNGAAAIAEDISGFIWIGFYDGALAKIDPKNMKLEYFLDRDSKSKNFYRGLSNRSMFFDKDQNLWISSNPCGIVEKKASTGEFIYHSELYEKDFPSNSFYRHINQTHDGIIWTGTQNGGLGKYDPKTHQFCHYTNQANNAQSISGNTVYHTYEESDSILWVATDKGLNRFNRFTEVFTNQSYDSEGFICAIYRIYPDNNGNLWLSGDCGIIKYNPITNQSTKYSKPDGLPATEFNTTAGCKTRQGEIFFGSSRGLTSFIPDSIKASPYRSVPILTNLKIFNKTVSVGDTVLGKTILDKDISIIKKITLPYNLNDFTIEFSAMHFSAPDKNQYFYKLQGFNDQWVKTNSSRRWANYTGLAPGNYTFFLESTNNDGLISRSKDMVELQIEILPPYYETWWFRSLIVFAIILLILLTFSLRLRSIRKQKEYLEKTVELRTEQLHNQNSMLEERQEEISVQNEELERHRNQLEEIVDRRTHALKNALMRAEETDRLKSAFLANMSHEIRTPMNAILGFTSLLEDEELTNEERKMYAEIILSNGESLLNLLNDILDRSVIESGQLKLHKKEFDLNKLLSDITDTFSKSKMVKGNPNLEIIIENNIKEPKLIFSDPIRLAQILNNLLSNALKFTNKGSIKISYTNVDNKIKFTISDTGIGIEEQAIDFIFDRFQKIENPDTLFYRGAGLGLSICQTLVEMLGGEIGATSKLGKGSTFHFTILAT